MPAIWKDTVVYAVGSATGSLYARVRGRVQRVNDGGRAFCRTSGRCEPGTSVAYTGVDLAGTRIAGAREGRGVRGPGRTAMVPTTPWRPPPGVAARGKRSFAPGVGLPPFCPGRP